jgi:hypothetical protein
MCMSTRLVVGVALSLVALATGGVPRARAEEGTIQATAPWTARARVFLTGARQAFLQGVFSGSLSVQSAPSALDGANLVCPTVVEADYVANTTRGEGRCVITPRSGDRLFARWTCTGTPDQSCGGRFVLIGGTGAYQGVTGEGDFTLRMTLAELTNFERMEAEYDLSGVAAWAALRYRTP